MCIRDRWEGNKRASVSRAVIISPRALFATRVVLFLSLAGMYAYFSSFVGVIRSLSFLTVWGHLLTTLFFIIAVIRYLTDNVGKKPTTNHLDLFGNILFQTALSMEFPVVLVYWAVLHNSPEMSHIIEELGTGFKYVNVLLHSFAYIVLWVDLMFNTVRCIRRHFYYVYGVGLVYLFINCMITVLRAPVYPVIMEWNDWLTVATVVMCSLLLFVHHRFVVKIYEKAKLPRLALEGYVLEDSSLIEQQSSFLLLFI
eukprot:TRINITY_DN16705_c0_g1_i1.p1 TRINITY_DN16705_c0_g1~~TRINITY_DN16705_c0_g1_i1.p1  ORF type:complete len:274 (-),score=57.92 TRINITY_DN16705_c0_g1_i1:63-827(-)